MPTVLKRPFMVCFVRIGISRDILMDKFDEDELMANLKWNRYKCYYLLCWED